MTAFQSTGVTTPCFGVTSSDVSQPGKLQAIANPNPTPDAAYPTTTDKRVNATLCDATTQDCTKVAPCSGVNGQEANCAVTTLDHFSTSFNWAQLNFASVLLRGWWYLLKDSSITDVQNGGLQMVTGGGYSRSDASQGFWNLSTHNLFVGNTQPVIPTTTDGGVPDNPFASNAGPFNPYALNAGGSRDCPFAPNGTLFCSSMSQGITFENAGFSNSQRLLNIYDGPTFEDSDAFSDIHTLNIGTLGKCRPDGNTSSGSCQSLGWMNAYNSGVIQNPGGNLPTNNCILPNAAISWKQPNGFYYPPAFDSQNLYFDPSVDIRHFVIDPLWQPGGFTPNTTAAMNNYCSWQSADFNNFTDVDRQTELTDLDGSLTGLLSGTAENNLPTISVNNDPISDPNSTLKDPNAPSNFFNTPLITHECATSVAGAMPAPNSGQPPTVYTSPYEYVTTAIFPACAGSVGYCSNWGQACTDQSCYGVPLYRQYLTSAEYSQWQGNHALYPSIRMMGQSLGQRSTLTMNHGSYYLDTTLPAEVQGATPPGGGTTPSNLNVFAASQSYLHLRPLREAHPPPDLQPLHRNRAFTVGGARHRRHWHRHSMGRLAYHLYARHLQRLARLDPVQNLQRDHRSPLRHHGSKRANQRLLCIANRLLPARQLLQRSIQRFVRMQPSQWSMHRQLDLLLGNERDRLPLRRLLRLLHHPARDLSDRDRRATYSAARAGPLHRQRRLLLRARQHPVLQRPRRHLRQAVLLRRASNPSRKIEACR